LISYFLYISNIFVLSLDLSDTNLLDVFKMHEFYRLRSNLRAKQEHASLLDDFKELDRTRLDLEEGGGSEQQNLLKERASISRSTGQVVNMKQFFVIKFCSFIKIVPLECVTYYLLIYLDTLPIKLYISF
jgi:hypothetical protein